MIFHNFVKMDMSQTIVNVVMHEDSEINDFDWSDEDDTMFPFPVGPPYNNSSSDESDDNLFPSAQPSSVWRQATRQPVSNAVFGISGSSCCCPSKQYRKPCRVLFLVFHH